MSRHALIGSVNHNTRSRQCLASELAQGRVVRRSPHTIQRTDSMISRSAAKSPSVTSDSTYSYTLHRCFRGLSRSRSPIAHDSYRMSTCTTVDVTQCCSGVNEDGLWRSRWVAAKKPSNSIWQGNPACWGRPGVQPWLPGLPQHREIATSAVNFGETTTIGL